jgi:hypothetical protein
MRYNEREGGRRGFGKRERKNKKTEEREREWRGRR